MRTIWKITGLKNQRILRLQGCTNRKTETVASDNEWRARVCWIELIKTLHQTNELKNRLKRRPRDDLNQRFLIKTIYDGKWPICAGKSDRLLWQVGTSPATKLQSVTDQSLRVTKPPRESSVEGGRQDLKENKKYN